MAKATHAASKMHADELEINLQLVSHLIAAQFPYWADYPLHPVPSAGTVNALYRLGDDLVIRLPRMAWGKDDIAKDARWLPQLAPLLPLAIPVPLAQGEPGAGYPWHWGIYRWLAGETAVSASTLDQQQAARDLAGFINALQQVTLADTPPPGRGQRLSERDTRVRTALDALETADGIAVAAATAVWDALLETAVWEQPPVSIHGDLIPTNLLVHDGRLTAVLDFGELGVGDPACDLVPAWSLFTTEARHVFRAALDVDDATWERGKGWALSQALLILPYYRHTNPVLVQIARHIITIALADHQHRLK